MTSAGEIHTQAETMAVHITDGVEVSGEMLDGSFGEVDVEIQGLAKMSVADAVVLNSNDAALSTSQTLNVSSQSIKMSSSAQVEARLEWHVGCCVTGRQGQRRWLS